MTLPIEGESPRGDQASNQNRDPRRVADLQKTITMAQIAKAAGVSQGAISSLLNDRDYGIRVSEKTRDKVFKVCREMGYIPNDLRAVVRMYPELGDYCLLLSSEFTAGLRDPRASRIAGAALEATQALAHSLTIACYNPATDYSGDLEPLPNPVRAGVASKYLVVGTPNPSLIQLLSKRGCPVVCLESEVRMLNVLSLLPDYHMASKLAIEHLFALGHRHVGIVSGPFGASEPHIIDLNHGVRLGCDQVGISIDAQNIIYGDLSFGAGIHAFEALMERAHPPSAIFCMSDTVAAGVIAAAQSRGRKVPEDISVIGCGGDEAAHLTWPELTTVKIPVEEMTTRGVQAMDQLLNKAAAADPKTERFGVELIERKSCARR